jgi:hypothetical protein
LGIGALPLWISLFVSACWSAMVIWVRVTTFVRELWLNSGVILKNKWELYNGHQHMIESAIYILGKINAFVACFASGSRLLSQIGNSRQGFRGSSIQL